MLIPHSTQARSVGAFGQTCLQFPTVFLPTADGNAGVFWLHLHILHTSTWHQRPLPRPRQPRSPISRLMLEGAAIPLRLAKTVARAHDPALHQLAFAPGHSPHKDTAPSLDYFHMITRECRSGVRRLILSIVGRLISLMYSSPLAIYPFPQLFCNRPLIIYPFPQLSCNQRVVEVV